MDGPRPKRTRANDPPPRTAYGHTHAHHRSNAGRGAVSCVMLRDSTPPSPSRANVLAEHTGRRNFVLGLSGLLAACQAPTRAPTSPGDSAPTPAPTPVPTATPDTTDSALSNLRGAEAVLGVEYDERERQALVGEIEGILARVVHTRTTALPNDLAPAVTFDPRPSGFVMPDAARRIRVDEAGGRTAPTTDDDIAFAPVTTLSAWLARGTVTSTQLVELYLDRLRRFGPALECVVALTEQRARDQARASDERRRRRRPLGPLDGIPWGAKDLLDVAGVPSTWGATPFADRVGSRDAVVVERLDRAGAVLVAKLTTGALAYGDIWSGGRTRNPWQPAEGSSGSSAGPASATAAGLCGFAIGSETYGSIVSPSMRCGTTGLRPTFGRVARSGTMALCWSLDKLGPITRNVEDTALVLAAINGADANDPSSIDAPFSYQTHSSLAGVRIGYVPAWFDGADNHAIDRHVFETLARLGANMVPITIPDHPYDALLSILLVEAAAAFEQLTLTNRDDELRWQEPEAWPNTFRATRFVSAIDFVQAERLRRRIMTDFERLFATVDCIAGPSFASPMLLATNFTGHPSLVLRAGFETRQPHGGWQLGEVTATTPSFEAPYGVSLWGKLFDEATLIHVGQALERELGVASRRPNLE